MHQKTIAGNGSMLGSLGLRAMLAQGWCWLRAPWGRHCSPHWEGLPRQGLKAGHLPLRISSHANPVWSMIRSDSMSPSIFLVPLYLYTWSLKYLHTGACSSEVAMKDGADMMDRADSFVILNPFSTSNAALAPHPASGQTDASPSVQLPANPTAYPYFSWGLGWSNTLIDFYFYELILNW